MWFSSWLRNRTSNRPLPVRAQHRSTLPSFRPQLEALEDRCVPSTLTVTTPLDNGAVGSLRYEIGVAQSGDTIVFAPSLNGSTITLGDSELLINKNLTIQGPGASLLAINGGSHENGYGFHYGSRVFEVDGAGTTVTLSGLTITDGGGQADPVAGFHAGDGMGGGILNYGNLTLSGCTVSQNTINPFAGQATLGAGIYNAGTLTVSSCLLLDNYANDFGHAEGGGIFNADVLTVSNSELYGNTADGGGGGIYNDAWATATVTGSFIDQNGTPSEGGGIFNQKHAKLTIQSSNITGNYDGNGVGADLYNLGTVKISQDSTVGSIGP
jgi:hypothetical protein